MIYYHVSPTANQESIRVGGVDPEKSKGRLKVSWWVAECKLLWAITHVSARHHVPTDEIDIWAFTFANDQKGFCRFAIAGVYHRRRIAYAVWHCTAMSYVNSLDWRNGEENMSHADDFAPPPQDVDDIPF